ncbi:MAG TPA: HAMP domain-containing protein, partial [Herpetosiphonaceae bacterium]
MNIIQRLKSSTLPLSVRLGLTLMLITAIAMGVVTSGLLFGVSWYESQRRAKELESQADFYQAFAAELVADNGDLQAAAPTLVKHSVSGGVAVRVFGTAGQIFGASGTDGLFPSRTVAPLLKSSVPLLLLSEDPDRRYSARRIERNGAVLGVVEVSQSLDEERRLFKLLGRVAAQATGIALLAAIAGAVIVARWLGRMIGGLRSVAERIAGGDLAVRAAERGPHEIASLTRALNAMADQLAERLERIQSQAEAQRRFYRDVSHELRTPLMALGGYLENLEDAPPGPEQERAIAALHGEMARLG